MKSVVLGKVVEIKHILETNQKTIIDENGKEKLVYTAKPKIKKEESAAEWREICRFKGEPAHNYEYMHNWKSVYMSNGFIDGRNRLNISENEEVAIDKKIFRADLGELHLFTNKVLEKIDIDAVDAADQLRLHTREFNKQMIESNEKMKAYCDLHGLKYEDSDCEQVFELVYPGDKYEISDGEMKVQGRNKLSYATYISNDLCTLPLHPDYNKIADSAIATNSACAYLDNEIDSLSSKVSIYG